MRKQGVDVWRGMAPALTLSLLAPVIAEILPGATRFSSIFVFPIEVCVWGFGTVLIREVVRRWQLDWRGLVCLALALSVAEEFVIQQTSVAPMVIHLKGVVYARAFGINYVYLVWALIYETVFVVVIPLALAEMVFFERRKERWLSGVGALAAGALFVAGALLAWFSWTHIARPKVFHVPAYQPPLVTTILACTAIGVLLVCAATRRRRQESFATEARSSPHHVWLFAPAGFVWAVLLYAIVLLGFGIAPRFPPTMAVVAGVALGLTPVIVWSRTLGTVTRHQVFWLVSGTVTGAMLAGFAGFIGASRSDLIFKIVADAIFLIFLIALRTRVLPASPKTR